MTYKTNKFNKNPDFEQKMIDIRRVARVMAGGRRFSFRVAVVSGNKKGDVGIGLGKAGDVASAMDKAFRDSRKKSIRINLTKDFSIPHDTEAKFSASVVILKPARLGRGLVAGSSVRTILDLVGIKNISAKIVSPSKNKVNNARAAIEALRKIK